jgi:hypothetical protein
MNHAMAICAQHRKIGSDIVSHRDALLERTNRFEMMRFNKTLANGAIALWETKVTGLAARAMKFLRLFGRASRQPTSITSCVYPGWHRTLRRPLSMVGNRSNLMP